MAESPLHQFQIETVYPLPAFDVAGVHVDMSITNSVLAMMIAVGLTLVFFFLSTVRATVIPGRLQVMAEGIFGLIDDLTESIIGHDGRQFFPYVFTLFLFILVANLLALIPTGHHPEYMPPPASDVNLTYALALLVIVWMHIAGVRKNGFRGYYRHLVQPYWFMLPINIVEEIAKPLTLALRLFGNIFSGVIMVSLIALFPAFLLWAPEVLWKLFDAAIGTRL